MTQDFSSTYNEPNIAEIDNIFKVEGVIRDLAEYFFKTYEFPKYETSEGRGRSSLSYQLENPRDIGLRDCKLPTYKLAEFFSSKGYECRLLGMLSCLHPFVLLPVPMIKKGSNSKAKGKVLRIGMSQQGPEIVVVRSGGVPMTWDEITDKETQSIMRMNVLEVNQIAIDFFDEKYKNSLIK